MGKTTPYGVSTVDKADDIPETDTGLRLGHGVRKLLQEEPEFSAEACMMLLDARKVFRQAAIRTLRRTVLGEEAVLQLLRPEGEKWVGGLAMPTASEMADYNGTIPILTATDSDKRDYAGIVPITPANADEVEGLIHDKENLTLRKLHLDKDAIEAVESNISDLHESIRGFVTFVDTDRQGACEHLEEGMALIARCLVLMKRSSPMTHNVEMAKDYTRQARDVMMESVHGLLNAEIHEKLKGLPNDEARRTFAEQTHGIFDLFFGKQLGGMQ